MSGNGAAIVDDFLNNWVLLLAHGKYFTGRLGGEGIDKGITLQPVFEVHQLQGVNPQSGQYESRHQVFLAFGMSSVEQLTFPKDSILHPMSRMTDNERAVLKQGVENMKALLAQIKKSGSEQARIVLAH
jgi:hypothetical protein